MKIDSSITGSIRTRGTSSKLLLCLNFKPSLVEQLELADRKFVEITHSGNSQYKMVFHKKDTGRCRYLLYNKSSNSAVVYVDQEAFKLSETEKKPAAPIPIAISEGKVVIDFNKESFLVGPPSTKIIRKIESKDDKLAAGLNPEAAWGVKYKEKACSKIKQAAVESLRLFLRSQDGSY